ncbi:MAG: hypothetical protein RBT61_03360 [Candidatus Kapabacteria bacterium]|nr:hypothetical protein [Candidatus Kapabacteria bacterium]
MKRLIQFIIMFVLYLFPSSVLSEDGFAYGINSGAGLVFNTASFSGFKDIPSCCPEYKGTLGYNVFFSGLTEYELEEMTLKGRAGVNYSGGNFVSSEHRTISFNGTPADGVFTHNLDFDITRLHLDVTASLPVYGRFEFEAGLSMSYSLHSSFKQFEKISSDAGTVYFADSNGISTGKSVRNEFSGVIPELNDLQFTAVSRISYNMYFKQLPNVIIRPEISYRHDFGNITSGTSWKTSSLNLGISVLFSSVKSNKYLSELKAEEELMRQRMLEKSYNRDSVETDELKKLESELADQAAEKERLVNELAMRDSLLAEKEKFNSSEDRNQQILRDEFDALIQEQNRLAGSICSCYVIMFTSTKNKSEAEKILQELNNSGVKNLTLMEFSEPYLNETYYRIVSECFTNHLDAFDKRLSIMNLQAMSSLNPIILCNR